MRAPRHLPSFSFAAFLFAFNAWLCAPLFWLHYSARVESAESTFISISAYFISHWRDLTWWPLWYGGIPVYQTYPPLLHAIVAAVAAMARTEPAHAHHIVTGIAYCLGGSGLFYLALRLTSSFSRAAWSGVAYSLFSPTALFVPWVRAEIGSAFRPWRICTLVLNGDGPHIAALALVPFCLVALDHLLESRRWQWFTATILLFCAVPLINWHGAFALTMSVALYLIARTTRLSQWRDWLLTGGAAVAAYLLACPLIPPSTVRLAAANSATMDFDFRPDVAAMPYRFAVILVSILAVKWICIRLRVTLGMQFAILWFGVLGGIPIAYEWAKMALVIQPHRYQLELDVSFCFLAVLILHALASRFPKAARYAVLVAGVIAALHQTYIFKQFMTALIQPIEMQKTIEFRVAQWLQSHADGSRVFAEGTVSFWLNAFSDVPQLAGGADQGLPNQTIRTGIRTIYGGWSEPSDPDGRLASAWLRAYGVPFVVAGDKHSAEYYKPFREPEKFRFIGDEVWRQGGDAIYRVRGVAPELAHFVQGSSLVTHAPKNGADLAEVNRFVAAITGSFGNPPAMKWTSSHSVMIEGVVPQDAALSLQVSYRPGWRAWVDGLEKPVFSDGLGLIAVNVPAAAHARIDLDYDGGWEGRITQWLSFGVALLLVILAVLGLSHRDFAASAITGRRTHAGGGSRPPTS